jgi:hypothetical protein
MVLSEVPSGAVDRRTLEAELLRKSNEKAECYLALRVLREIRAGPHSASSSRRLAEMCSRYQGGECVPGGSPPTAEQQSELAGTLIDTIVKRCLRLDSELKIISDRLRNTPA